MNCEKTCGNCANLFVGGIPPRMPLAACKVTDNIVPHEWDGKVFSFTHVPDNCPKSDGVIKATKPTFKKEWVIKTLDEIQSP